MVGVAHAAGPAIGGAAGGFASFIPLILIFVVFYFLLIRPQQKQAKQHQVFLSELKKGQKVLTKGGIYGVIQSLNDNVLTIEIARDVVIKVSRDAVAGAADSASAAVSKDDGKTKKGSK